MTKIHSFYDLLLVVSLLTSRTLAKCPVAPDLFNGTPAPAARDPYNPSYNQTEFLARHNPTVIDPMIDATIRYIRDVLGISRIVASGYCFGGRHAVRVLSEGRGVSASFAAHPALL